MRSFEKRRLYNRGVLIRGKEVQYGVIIKMEVNVADLGLERRRCSGGEGTLIIKNEV